MAWCLPSPTCHQPWGCQDCHGACRAPCHVAGSSCSGGVGMQGLREIDQVGWGIVTFTNKMPKKWTFRNFAGLRSSYSCQVPRCLHVYMFLYFRAERLLQILHFSVGVRQKKITWTNIYIWENKLLSTPLLWVCIVSISRMWTVCWKGVGSLMSFPCFWIRKSSGCCCADRIPCTSSFYGLVNIVLPYSILLHHAGPRVM